MMGARNQCRLLTQNERQDQRSGRIVNCHEKGC